MAPPACISREYFLQEINEDGVSYWKCKFCTYAYKGEVYASLLSRKHLDGRASKFCKDVPAAIKKVMVRLNKETIKVKNMPARFQPYYIYSALHVIINASDRNELMPPATAAMWRKRSFTTVYRKRFFLYHYGSVL